MIFSSVFENINVRLSLKNAPQMPPIKATYQRQQRWSDGDEGLSLDENSEPRLRTFG